MFKCISLRGGAERKEVKYLGSEKESSNEEEGNEEESNEEEGNEEESNKEESNEEESNKEEKEIRSLHPQTPNFFRLGRKSPAFLLCSQSYETTAGENQIKIIACRDYSIGGQTFYCSRKIIRV